MKEFDESLKNIFSGLFPLERVDKRNPGLEECHNLEPIDNDYKLHESVRDMNAGDTVWWEGSTGETPGTDYDDVWEDHDGDVWEDDDEDVWKDI